MDITFLQDLQRLEIPDTYLCKQDGKIFLYFYGLYRLWSTYQRQVKSTEPPPVKIIKRYLQDQPGFIAKDEVKRINIKIRRCITFIESIAPKELQQVCTNT